jgi:hypothetical protein
LGNFREKLAFFSKTNVVIIWLSFALKNANFLHKIFGENIYKMHNIGPWIGTHYLLRPEFGEMATSIRSWHLPTPTELLGQRKLASWTSLNGLPTG